jgi:hypothetical protein
VDKVQSYNGAMSVNTSLRSTSGIIGNAFSFNGANDNVKVSHSYGYTNATLSFWFNASSINPEMWLVNKYLDIGNGWGVRMVNSSANDSLQIYDDLGGKDNRYYSTPVAAGTWNYVVAQVQDNNVERLYLNGQLISSDKSASALLNSFNGNLFFGARYGSQGYFNGKLDEVRIRSDISTADWINSVMKIKRLQILLSK